MKKLETKSCIKLAVTLFILYLCIHYWENAANLLKTVSGAALPLIIGGAVAYPLNILMSFYERHFFTKSSNKLVIKSRRSVCVILSLLTLVAIFTLVIALVVPQVTACVKMVIAQLPGFMDAVVEKLSHFDIVPENIIESLSEIDWKSKITENIKTLTSGLGNVMGVVVSTVSSVVSGVTTTFLSLIFAVYLLLSKDTLLRQIKRLAERFVPEKINGRINYVAHVSNECFRKFIVAQCTEAIILGSLCTVGMLILRLPYAAMIGAVTCVTSFIPVVGGLIGGGIGAFLILMQSPVKALIFLVFIILLQQIEGDLIYPRVVGSSIGLPSIWVLAAITVGGGVFGVMGMLLGVPVASTVYRLLGNELNGTDVIPGEEPPEKESTDGDGQSKEKKQQA